MNRRSIPALVFTAVALAACSEQLPVSPDASPDGARLAAQAAAGTYEVTFHSTGNYAIGDGVTGTLVGNEMGLRANVRDSQGNLATKGSVTFYRCERNKAPQPSATCNTGLGTWTRYHRIRMDSSGYPPTVYGGRCTSPTIVGFRFDYEGQGSGIASGASAARDFEWYAA